mgnify:FL=1
MLLAQYWRSFQSCAIFDCECGAVLGDLRHDERRGGEKLMNCQRSDVLVLRMLVRPVKMNPGPALDRPLPADSVEKVASAAATAFFVSELSALFGSRSQQIVNRGVPRQPD